MRHNPMPPIQAITNFVGEDIVAHEDLLQEAYARINSTLPKICEEGEFVGIERAIFVKLPGITQAALLEIVLKYRAAGWKVDYGIDYTTFPREPMLIFTIPAKG